MFLYTQFIHLLAYASKDRGTDRYIGPKNFGIGNSYLKKQFCFICNKHNLDF